MVLDFDITATTDNNGIHSLELLTQTSSCTVLGMYLEQAPTSKWEQTISGGASNISASYSIPQKSGDVKSITMILRLFSVSGGTTNLNIMLDQQEIFTTAITTGSGVLTYSLNDDNASYTVTKITNKQIDTIVIPEILNDGLPVTAIGNEAFKDCTNLTDIIIPNTVKSIGVKAFYNTGFYNNAANWADNGLTLGSALIKVRNSGFTYTVSSKINCIAADAFDECTQQIEIDSGNISYSMIEGNLYNREGTELVRVIRKNIQTFSFPQSVTDIGSNAFYNCTSLANITIPERITKIGAYAFFNCTSIKSVTIPENVITIGRNAFDGCTKLTDLYFNATSMNDLLSDNCAFPSIKTAKIGANVKYLPAYLFYGCKSLSDVTFELGGVNLNDIGAHAFEQCANITEFTIPESITSIENDTFSGCTRLESIDIPSNVKSIKARAFYLCTSLTSLKIGNGVVSIEKAAFAECCSITQLNLPNSVKTIGGEAFYNCYLNKLTIGTGIQSIGSQAFYQKNGNGIEELHVSDIVKWCSIDFISANANPLYYAINFYIDGELVTELEIPDDVTEISNFAFYFCDSLKTLKLSDSVTKIGEYAFSNCTSLKKIKFGKGLKTIDGHAFEYCSSLKKCKPKKGLESVGDSAFYCCPSITYVTINKTNKYIGAGAFYGCDSLWMVFGGSEHYSEDNMFSAGSLLRARKLKESQTAWTKD